MREVMLNNAGKYDDINMILWCQIKNNIARNIQHDHSAFSEMISAWQKKNMINCFYTLHVPMWGDLSHEDIPSTSIGDNTPLALGWVGVLLVKRYFYVLFLFVCQFYVVMLRGA